MTLSFLFQLLLSDSDDCQIKEQIDIEFREYRTSMANSRAEKKGYRILTLRRLLRPPVWLSQLDLRRGTNFDQQQPRCNYLSRLFAGINQPVALAIK